MRIAVNASFFKKDHSGNDRNFFFDLFLKQSQIHSKHTFIFIFNKLYPSSLVFPENIIPVVIGPEGRTPLTWRIWHNFKIPSVLKKYKADIFITEKFCSLRTNVPQLLFYPDLNFIHQPWLVNEKHLSFYKKYTPLFLDKCDAVVVDSTSSKNDLMHRYQIDEQKVSVFFPIVDEGFRPLNYEEREIIKEKYAEGHEYFIYNGIISPHQNLKNLLKAFSAFKKRQKSSMQLLIAGEPGVGYEEWLSALGLYRFHAEVKVLHNVSESETKKIVAAAYAMVYTPFFETSYKAPLQAMACEVPLIVADAGALPEVCGDSALHADPNDFKAIAEKMMLLFKDERLRKDLIQKGAQQLKNVTSTRLPIHPFHGFSFFES